MNISSLVVDVQPARAGAVQMALRQWPGVEIHAATPEGKLIVTLETDTDGQTTDTFTRIGAVEGVMSVALVYHQFEPDPDSETEA
jgi:nitrate reductase NapD